MQGLNEAWDLPSAMILGHMKRFIRILFAPEQIMILPVLEFHNVMSQAYLT